MGAIVDIELLFYSLSFQAEHSPMGSIELPPSHDSDLQIFKKTQRAKPRLPPPSTSLHGQTAIITGSNIGIGLESARMVLELGLSHLILAVRTVGKGEVVANTFRKSHSEAKIEVWALDMLSYESIQAFAQKCATLPRLDFAILNAGLTTAAFTTIPSTGHEEMFQVNYLSTALLAILLLPTLEIKSPRGVPGRLTIVSSGLALTSAFPNRSANPLIPTFDDPKGWGLWAANERYAVTKTLVLMFVYKLSQIVSSRDVVVNTVDPGFTKGSSLHRNVPAPLRAIFWVMKALYGRPLMEAASTYVDAAVVKGQETHGSFVMAWDIHP